MARHLSGRQPRLNIGITSYTDSLTVLQVTGKVAIGTTNAGPYSLYVVGDTNIQGVVGLNTITAFSGIITNLAGTNLNYAGIGTINNFISTTASINTLDGNIVRYNTGIITSIRGNNLYYNSGIVTNILGTNLNYTGIGTVNNFISTTANITNLSGNVLRFNSGIVTNIQGTNLFYSGIGTIGSFIATNSTILTLSGSAVRYSSGIITNISGTNLNYTGISTFNAQQGPLYVGSATSTGTIGQTFQVVGIYSGAYIGGNVGIGSTRPTSKLSVQGDVLISGVVTSLGAFVGVLTGPAQYSYSSGFTTVAVHAGVSTISSVAGFSSVSIQSGVTTIAAVAGFATVASIAGYTTYSGTAGFSSVATIAGFATVTAVAGFATVATHAGVSTISSVAGFATVATRSGISTTVAGGIASVTQLSVTGISTFNVGIFSGNTSTDLVRITQLGTGNALVVEDSANPDSSPFVVNSNGQVGIGSALPIAALDIVGGGAKVGTAQTYVEFGGDSGRNIEIGTGSTTLSSYIDLKATPTYTDYATRLIRNAGDNANFDIINRGTGSLRLITQDAGSIDFITSGNIFAGRIDPNGIFLVGTASSTGTLGQDLQVTGGAYISDNVGIGSTNPPSKLSVVGDASIVGVVTANRFFGPLTGIAASATQLVTPRDFSIVGAFITAANIAFDGTANVALAATVVPNSIGLGTYTSGDYVRYITGTANQIEVIGGLGEGSTPRIGLPTDVSITNNLSVGNDLFVGGNVTVGGTSFVLNVSELRAENKELVLGFTTTAPPNDTSANYAAIAVASTEGTPIVSMSPVLGLTTLPNTYKQIRWVRSGTWAGLATDAFIFNYGVGIGSTYIPFGVRLAVGSGIQMTDTNISSPQGQFSSNLLSANTISGSNQQNSGVTTSLGGFIGNLRGAANYAYAAGFSTFSSTSGFSTVASIAGFTTQAAVAGFATNATRAGVATFSSLAGSAGFATVATQAGISTNTIGGVVDVNSLRTTGIATFSAISVGGTTGVNQYVLTSTGLGLAWQAVTGIGAISGVNITPDNTNKVYYIPFVNVSAGTTATQYVDTNVGLVYNPGAERLGIGTTNPGSTLDVIGTLYVSDYITSPTFYGNFVGVTSGVTFYAYNAGVSTIAAVAGFATVSIQAGVSTIASVAGFATVSSRAGVSTLAEYAYIAGFSTVSRQAGVSTIASVAGFSTVASIAGFSTVSAVAGFATVATQAGVSTLATYAYSAGFTTFSGVSGFATVATQAGISSSTVSVNGVVDVNLLDVTGVSTFVNGPVFIGAATSTGTASQRLQVTGGGHFSGSVGVGVTNPVGLLDVGNSTFTNIAAIFGGDENANTRTNATNKSTRLGIAHFTNSEEPAALLFAQSISGSNLLSFGGGTFLMNAATFIDFYTAANGITTFGTKALRIDDNQRVGIGTDIITARLEVSGDTRISGALTAVGGFNIGIQSAGLNITTGVITALNFIGLGNTFRLRGTTVDISIAGGGGSGGNNLSISTSSATDFQYLSFVASASTSILGISSTANPIVFTPASGNLGLGTTSATSKLTVRGDVLVTGVTTSTGGFRGQLTGVANYSYVSGFSTYAGNVGFATFAGIAGFATVSTIAGVATFANISSVAGFATVSTQAGVSSFSAFANLAGAAGFSTFSSTSGFSTFASISGFSTVSAVAGFSSVSTMAGFSTISSVAGFSTFASTAGFSTFASTSGFSTMATIAGIATNVVTGVASIRTLQVTGISTFTFGPVYIGAGQTIGITSAVVQIAGINSSMYVGGKVGIGTTDFTYGLNVNGDINTASVIRVNGRNILDDAVIYAIALG
jgi:hypothetical protein